MRFSSRTLFIALFFILYCGAGLSGVEGAGGFEPVAAEWIDTAAHGWILNSEYVEWEDAEAGRPIPLENLDGEITAYLYPVHKGAEVKGYVTISAIKAYSPLFERAAGSDFVDMVRRYGIDYDHRLLFLGNLYYFVEIESDNHNEPAYIHLPSLEVYEIEKIEKIQELFYEREEDLLRTSRDHWTDMERGEFFTGTIGSNEVPNAEGFGWYRGCGPTTITMMLRCYGRNGYPAMNENMQEFYWCGLRKRTARLLHDRVANSCGMPYDSCDYNQYGVTVFQMRNSFTDTAATYGYNMGATVDGTPSYNEFKAEIDQGDPVGLAIYNDNGPMDYDGHAIMGYGYIFNAQHVALVFDTWTRNPRQYALENLAGWNMVKAEPGSPPQNTPTPTPTQPPPPTFTPTQGSTATPTPSLTPTPSPTFNPQNPFVILQLNGVFFTEGDMFDVSLNIWNPEESQLTYIMIALDLSVFGLPDPYYFWPQWNQSPAMVPRRLPASKVYQEKILGFQWPETSGEVWGLRFWTAVFDASGENLFANLFFIDFGYK